ncbi:MAG: hypothetical protein WDA75_00405 [Candidatus Latescibacterota bacterium]|jgi:hypothetical protein
MNDEPIDPAKEDLPLHHCRDYRSNNPTINLRDTMGALILGAISLILLVSWMRAMSRLRKLETQLGGRR